MCMQADRGNRGYFPFGTGSARNPFSQEDRKEAFNAYGAPDLSSHSSHELAITHVMWLPSGRTVVVVCSMHAMLRAWELIVQALRRKTWTSHSTAATSGQQKNMCRASGALWSVTMVLCTVWPSGEPACVS